MIILGLLNVFATLDCHPRAGGGPESYSTKLWISAFLLRQGFGRTGRGNDNEGNGNSVH